MYQLTSAEVGRLGRALERVTECEASEAGRERIAARLQPARDIVDAVIVEARRLEGVK